MKEYFFYFCISIILLILIGMCVMVLGDDAYTLLKSEPGKTIFVVIDVTIAGVVYNTNNLIFVLINLIL